MPPISRMYSTAGARNTSSRFSERSSKTKTTTTRALSLSWVDRLNIANQLAVDYQYSKRNSMTITRLEDVGSQIPLSLRNLWSELRSIRYNLNTNNGRIFLGGEDEERLDRLINHIANSLCFSEFEANN